MPAPARLTALAAVALLTACGTQPAAPGASPTVAASTRAPSSPTPSPTPTPSASPTPTVDPASRKQGSNHSVAADAYVFSSEEVHDWLHGRKQDSPTYPKDRHIAFLTFDDGPTNTTPKVLDELKANGVHASFFIIGGQQGLAKSDPGLVRREIAEGHSVCMHSYSHSFSDLYPGGRADADHVRADHERVTDATRNVLGDDFTAHCQRYPGGHGWKGMDPADRALAERGAYWLDWNSENGDGRDKASSTGAGRAAQALSTLGSKPNVAVVLMHDYRDNEPTVDGIRPIVERLRADGYEFGVLD